MFRDELDYKSRFSVWTRVLGLKGIAIHVRSLCLRVLRGSGFAGCAVMRVMSAALLHGGGSSGRQNGLTCRKPDRERARERESER